MKGSVSIELFAFIFAAALLFGSLAIVQRSLQSDQNALTGLVATHEARLKQVEDRLCIKPASSTSTWERIVK